MFLTVPSRTCPCPVRQGFFPELVAVLFQDDPARNDDVSAGLVQFNYPELVGLSDKGIHVGYLAQINLRAGKKASTPNRSTTTPPLIRLRMVPSTISWLSKDL